MCSLPYGDFREVPLHAEIHDAARVSLDRIDVSGKVGVEAEVVVALRAHVVEWHARLQQGLDNNFDYYFNSCSLVNWSTTGQRWFPGCVNAADKARQK